MSNLIIGVGNPHRGDDAVGRRVARRLKRRHPAQLEVLELSGEATSLMDAWKDADSVIIIDAVHSDAEPGSVYRIDPHMETIPHCFFSSTHDLGPGEAVELAKALHQLPEQIVIFGIAGADFNPGARLSPKVKKAAIELEALILREFAGQH